MLLCTCLNVINYVKSHITFDLDNIPDETIITKRQPLKQQQKHNFATYLFKHNIMNSRHYDDELARSEELRQLEFTIQLKDLEIIKKTIFRQVYLQQRNIDVLTPRIVVSNNKSRLGALMFFLSNIALENQISVNRLKQLLCNFIFNLNHKKRGLILCGPSDSGKTYGTTKRKRNATPWTFALRPTQYVNTLMEKRANIQGNFTPMLSSPAMSWTNPNEVPKVNNSEFEEHISENDNTSAGDVPTSQENGTDTTVTSATREFRLSTLLPLLTTRMLLCTCLNVNNYVKSHITFDLDNIPDETIITKRQPLKQQQKHNFATYLFKHNILNSRHYDDELARSEELRQLEFTIQLKDLEIIKKTIFRQVYLQQRNIDVLTPRIVVSNNKSRLGALMFFLSNIALQNQISVNRLKQLLCNFIFNLNHKKRGLILCGPSESGKTFLANLLYSNFKPHEIGYFNCPTGPNPSAFLLQALSNCLAYRCDEMVFEHLGVIQLMKQLLEGSNTLTTDVKYNDAMLIDPHPTLITMNSTSKFDILKWHPSEYQAFENRCTILFLGTPLLNIFNDKELQEINTCGPELLYMLSMHKLDKDTCTAGVSDKFQDFIFL
ncbi:uncharacterized protein LOC124817009 isoform X1 [Hydra vulgaris]|uniref:uncharacterized protein LOC124817009 isoform X1 n=1 Tax=Hydra vulgaris TaxID=6087 RepID=UPI001F5EF208|nr:uncharacterized protein LOC124817009 isoform X1 [Hydra vulgaris]